jgi:hypothetical protein
MIDLFPAGIGVGDSRTKTIRGHTYTAALVDRGGGMRALEVTSEFHNRFTLDFRLCNPSGASGSIIEDAQGGCADETCTDVRYDGQINVDVTVNKVADFQTVRDALRTATGAGNRVLVRFIRLQPGGQYQGLITVQDADMSVQLIAGLLPSDWIKTTTDRKISVTIPSAPKASLLGDWQGDMEISAGTSTIPCVDPLCARLFVQTEGNGLRIWYCDGNESQCDASAKGEQCALQFTAAASGNSFTGTGVDNNAPCCIGCLGQNRAYGCGISATLSVDSTGEQTLEGDFLGTVTSCPSDNSGFLSTHFKFCRPSPCE